MFIIRIFTLLPFIGVLVAIYALLSLGGTGWMEGSFALGGDLNMNNGEAFSLMGLLFLALEVIKSTNTRGWSIANHGLSMLVFVVALVLFLTVDGYATVPFLMITAMALIDVLIGMIVTIVTARRDIGLGGFDAG